MIRLILEYLNIPYIEVCFKSPKTWEIEGKPLYKDLPCLKDGDFMVHEVIPIITYILKKNGHS